MLFRKDKQVDCEELKKKYEELLEIHEASKGLVLGLAYDNHILDARDFVKSGMLHDYGDRLLKEKVEALEAENAWLSRELTTKSQEYFYIQHQDNVEKMWLVTEEQYKKIEDYNRLIKVLSDLGLKL